MFVDKRQTAANLHKPTVPLLEPLSNAFSERGHFWDCKSKRPNETRPFRLVFQSLFLKPERLYCLGRGLHRRVGEKTQIKHARHADGQGNLHRRRYGDGRGLGAVF